ncbi:MAG: hypothetical protein ACK4EX_09370 [Thermaurantimonas sp.]|uniref:hypothetical protein n=1 Tax=Thermaurantimonas sp. TaxID=2681568 RepID=UPI00391BBFE9
MRKIYKNFFLKIFPVPTIVLIFIFACNNQQKEEEILLKQAKAILINPEKSSALQIENIISSIKTFLAENPDTKRYEEFTKYIDELYRHLDIYKISEYNSKFEELSTKTYHNINAAIKEQDDFLKEFNTIYGSQLLTRHPEINTLIENVKNIKEEFKSMKLLFESDFYDLETFNTEVSFNAHIYKNSNYETVRNSFDKIADNQRNLQATKDLNRKVANFEEYLRNDAVKICNQLFDDFVLDNSKGVQTISIGNPYQHTLFTTRACDGIFRVYLKGAFLGWDRGSVKIYVKGLLYVATDENQMFSKVEYRNLDYQILETTGDL